MKRRRRVSPSGASAQSRDAAPFVTIECPYCGESFETRLDLSAGSASYIEDCQVCCQPIEFRVEVDDGGALQSVDARRAD